MVKKIQTSGSLDSILVLPLISGMTWGKLPNLSVPWYPDWHIVLGNLTLRVKPCGEDFLGESKDVLGKVLIFKCSVYGGRAGEGCGLRGATALDS